MNKSKKRAGFTLVELSAAIVVIAILFLGVLQARALIDNATLRRVIAETEDYTQKVSLFYNQYISYPGDFPLASKIWGTQCASTITNCNGDGDGYIDFNSANLNTNEAWRAWQHLALAQLDKNLALSGIGTSATSVLNYNVPESYYGSGMGWSFKSYTSSLTQKYTTVDLYNVKANTNSGLKVTEIQMVDQKMDDGLPRRGKIQVMNATPSTNCYSTASSPYQYILTATGKQCAMQVVIVQAISHPNYEW